MIMNLLGGRVRRKIEEEALYADISNPENLYNLLTPIVFLFGVIGIYLLNVLLQIKILLIVPLFILSLFIPYAVITMAAEKRRHEIEEVLPDALLLMSANIKSGLTVDKALLVSARDEFGPLAKEIKKASMEIFGGSPVEKALDKLRHRTNSAIFQEVIKLIVDGVKSGGEISGLLESSAKDIRKTLLLKKEIDANVKMYVLFIVMAAVFGAPLLFGISTYLVETTFEVWGGQKFDFSEVQGSIFNVSKPTISPEFFQNFAIAALVISNLFAALIISEIKYGNIRRGYKSIPIFIIVSLVIFFIIRIGVQKMIGAFIS